MVTGWEDKDSADWLYGIATGLAEAGSTFTVLGEEDQTYRIDDSTQILLDAGRPNQSLILDEALKLIDEAQEWVTISGQFFPHGETGERLKLAHERGVNVTAIYNDPTSHTPINGLWQRNILRRERNRLPTELFENQLPARSATMHSALLATDQATLKGGHNLVATGVKFGTPEVAVLQRNSIFANAAAKLLAQQVEFISTTTPESVDAFLSSHSLTPLAVEG